MQLKFKLLNIFRLEEQVKRLNIYLTNKLILKLIYLLRLFAILPNISNPLARSHIPALL